VDAAAAPGDEHCLAAVDVGGEIFGDEHGWSHVFGARKALNAAAASGERSRVSKCRASAWICVATASAVGCFISCLVRRTAAGGLAASLLAAAIATARVSPSATTSLTMPYRWACAAVNGSPSSNNSAARR